MNAATERLSTVVGAFEDRRQAETAVRDLRQAGFREDQIRVEEVRHYRGESEASRTSVTVLANGRSDEAATILRHHGDGDVHVATNATVPRTGEAATLQLREEELHAHKQLVETGEVRVRKEVITEHRTIEVPVQREEIVIERHAPTGARLRDRPQARPGDPHPSEEGAGHGGEAVRGQGGGDGRQARGSGDRACWRRGA